MATKPAVVQDLTIADVDRRVAEAVGILSKTLERKMNAKLDALVGELIERGQIPPHGAELRCTKED